MRVAVLSDLHVGSPPVPGAFGHDPAAFDRWLGSLLDTHDRVVLNGDVVQCDHTWAWGTVPQRRALDRALAAHPWLARRAAHPRVTWLPGNHDAIVATARGAPPWLRLDGATGALIVTHGDRFDPVLQGITAVSHAATWAMGRARAAGLGALADRLEGRDISIKSARFQGDRGPYARGAAALLAEHDADVVVLGHTHVACAQPVPGGLLLNPGSASRGLRAWVSVDLDRGTARLCPGGGAPERDLAWGG